MGKGRRIGEDGCVLGYTYAFDNDWLVCNDLITQIRYV